MQHQIGLIDLFKRCTEGGYQIMRQILYKSYGVSQDYFFACRQLQHTRSRIEGGEQLVLNIYIGICKLLKQR
ncbi:hypothetical protein D3C75_1049900 [compost metagenome]